MEFGFGGLKKRKPTRDIKSQGKVATKLDGHPNLLHDRKAMREYLEDLLSYQFDPIYSWADSMYEALKQAQHIEDAGLALQAACALTATPADSTTYYFGGNPNYPLNTGATISRLYVPRAGVIRKAYMNSYAVSAAGTDEDITIYLRLNGNSDTTIATVGNADAYKYFSNAAMTVSVSQGDFVNIKVVTPAWATNPTDWYWWGTLYLE